MKNKFLTFLTLAVALVSGTATAQDMLSSFANSSNGYIRNGVRTQLMGNGGYYYGGNAPYYSQQGVVNRAKVGAAASVVNLTASIPGAIMHERDLRLAREAQIIAQQQAFDQNEYERTGIMSPQMKADYEKQVALQNEADRSLSPSDLAEVKQYRIDEEMYRMQSNPNYRGPTAQNAPTATSVANVLGNRDPNAPVSANDMQLLQTQQQTNAQLKLRLAEAQRVHQQLLNKQNGYR